MNARLAWVLMLGTGVMSTPAAAQGIATVPQLPSVLSAERVRTLYSAAAYEDALAAIPTTNGEVVKADLEQYRALCLLALGREQDAVSTIERLVRDHPTFVPSSAETSPRMLSIFKSVRSKLVPALAKQAYLQARAAYDSKALPLARAAFQQTLEIIGSLPEADQSPLSDLRLLAEEFRALAAAQPGAAAAPQRLPNVAPVGEFVSPVALREPLPMWIPPDSAARSTEYTGLLRIEIGADGRVTSAKIVKRSHPTYDLMAVNAAKLWLYKPAVRDGQPVASHKDIHLRLVPK